VNLIISGVVTVLGHPGRGASQVEKSPRLNWATHMFLSEWREFPLAPCLAGKKKLDDCSRLDVVEIICLTCFHSASVTRKDLHMNRPLFPTTLSILSFDIGK
jgi:hypothetical protein